MKISVNQLIQKVKQGIYNKKIRILILCISLPLLLFFLLNILFPLKIDIDYSQSVMDKKGNVLQTFLTYDDKWRLYTELDEISDALKKAIIAKEDKYFYYHPGINIIAIGRASINNLFYQKRTSGASTITMQVARLLEPRKRTYSSKIIELFRSLQLEWMYSKDEILQLYINLVPYGGNIEGVKSASLLYFQKKPDFLSLAEIVTLTIVPNRPSSLQIGKHNETLLQERNKWLNRLGKEHVFPIKEINEATLEPLDAKRTASPKLAPHFCRRVIRMFKGKSNIYTPLDSKIQFETENLCKNYIQKINHYSIQNAACIIIDNASGQVISYVGSSDFFNTIDGGQVDGVKAIRQPGSTLKPLLYGLCIDKGWITPQTVISDVSINFNGYRPENFDRKFNGYVTIAKALGNSLNIPAVKLLNQLQVDTFTKVLVSMECNQIKKDEKNLGLSMALGGCGISLEELCGIYAMFAREGIWKPIQWLKDTSQTSFSKQILSKEAAFIINDILLNKERPDFPVGYENSYHLPKVAWKTGTSYGRRDAWSIGYNKKYTVAVWCGNFNGEGVPELTGTDIATPLLFEIYNSLDYDGKNDWYQMPAKLDFRYVCNISGKVPNSYCTNQVMDYYIPLVSSNAICQHLRDIYISSDDKMSYCNACVPTNGYKIKTIQYHEPEMLQFFEQHHIPYDKIPEHNYACEKIYTYGAPDITSPSNGMTYILDKNESKQLLLSCQTGIDVKKVYWYINNKLYKEANASEKIFIQPDEGILKISCSDDKGRNSDVQVTIKYSTF